MSIDAVTQERLALDRTSSKRESRRTKVAGFIMLLTDTAALQLCVFIAYLVRLALSPIWPMDPTPDQYGHIAMGVAAVPLAFLVMGYYPGYGRCPVKRLRLRALTTLALFGVLIAWTTSQPYDNWAPFMLVIALPLALVIPWLFEASMREVLVKMRWWGRPVVVLGTGEAGSEIIRTLKRAPETGFIPVAAFDDKEEEWGRVYEGIRVEGSIDDAAAWSAKGVNTALIAQPGLDGKAVCEISERLPFEQTIVIPNLFGTPSAWVTSVDFQSVPGMTIKNHLRARHNQFLKRCVDFLVTVPACIAAVPIVLIAGIAIKLTDGGPIFFMQKRRGLNNRVIEVLKIRTMYTDADVRLQKLLETDPAAKEEWERFYKLKKDPRILPGVGHILRKSSLDEIPQLFNVLRGDMTLIGPRPFPDYHLEQFHDEDFTNLRASVMPGLTGYWQVSARSDGDLEVQKRLDTYYIRNWSIWLDFYILMRTVLIVVRGAGAY